MTDHHCTLELAQHDNHHFLELSRHVKATRAPERDHDATAFERDVSCLAPEVLPSTAPQVLYRNSLPEVSSIIKESSEVPIIRDAPRRTLKRLWLLIALVLVAAVAIGVGVGVWHARRKSSAISQPVANPSTPDSTPPPTPTPTKASTTLYILNDTSLAAVILPNNDRHLYFQDSIGRIRYVIRTASTNQWNTSPDSNITASARDHTPLAVTAFKPVGPVKIELFYVSQNHQLSSSITNSSTGAWQNDDSLINYTTAPNTRSLSVTSNIQAISNATNKNSRSYDLAMRSTTTMAVLFYETLNGSMAVLSRLAERCPSCHDLENVGCSSCQYYGRENPIYTNDYRNSNWIDNRTALQEICKTFCYTPFASSEYRDGIYSGVTTVYRGPWLRAYDRSNIRSARSSFSASWTGVQIGKGLTDSDLGLLKHSDMAVININSQQDFIWVKNSKPIVNDNNAPKNTFPFARLASATTPDNQTTYLYHQMNETTFAEESYELSVGDWGDTTYINVIPL